MIFAVLFSTISLSAQDITSKINRGKEWHLLGLNIVSQIHYEDKNVRIPLYPDLRFDLYYSRKKENV